MYKTILCIDDDPITIMLSEKVIAKASFCEKVLVAYDGEEALKILDEIILNGNINIPEIIFLDLNMPVISGWDFLEIYTRKYANILKNTAIIILSSSIDPNEFLKAKNYPVVSHFLSKPITVELLNSLK